MNLSKLLGVTTLAGNGLAVVALVSLHFLSPEFDPAWRVLSEYANGNYGSVLATLFAAWGVATLGLAVGLWRLAATTPQRIGVGFLAVSAVGQWMAAFFDIKHPLHDLAGFLGVGCLPIAALLLGRLHRRPPQGGPDWGSRTLAALPAVALVGFVTAFVVLMVTYSASGVTIDPTKVDVRLPEGVIAVVGWANRALVLAYLVWSTLVARSCLEITYRGATQ